MRDEVWWQPPAFREAGLYAPGRGLAGEAASPWAGVEGGVQPTLSTLLINLPGGGDQRGEARSNTSEEEPQGKEAESFGLKEIKFFKNPNFLQVLSSRGVKMMCCHEKKKHYKGPVTAGLGSCLLHKNNLCSGLNAYPSFFKKYG